MKAFLVLGLLAACSADEPPRVQLAGTLWFMHDATLMRMSGGTTTAIARDVYPSAATLPDGSLVAIYSRGDGETGEQLVIVTGNQLRRVGPVAAQVRDPVVLGDSIVAALTLDGRSDLYKIALDGATERLTNDPAGNYHPAVAGDSIVYVSSRDGDAEIYKGAERLTHFYKDDFDPTPSPDGKTIVFASDREGPARLFAMVSDGTNLHRVTARTDDTDETDAVWSRDGKLAYVAGGHVFIGDRDLGPGAEPAFSPDGHWLALVRPDGSLSAFPDNGGEAVTVARAARLPRWL